MSASSPDQPVLKDRLRADLTTAMKAKDTLTVSTLRMALAALTNEEVAGTAARALSDADVVTVLAREIKKRKEAAGTYAAASRVDLADRETGEAAILQGYLPEALTDDQLAELVGQAVAEVAAATGTTPDRKQLGQVIKAAQAKAAGRADGARIATVVRAVLG